MLLKAAGLVLHVFSPQNYRDERTRSVLREEKRFSACAVVLNKIDLVTPEELQAITTTYAASWHASDSQMSACFGPLPRRIYRGA